LSVLFGLIVSASGPHDFWIFMTLLSGFVGLVFTPIALHRAFKQLKASPGKYRGRNLAVAALLTYAAVAPLLLLLFAAILTEGLILFPLGVGAFAFVQYRLIQHLHHRVIATLPEDPPTESAANLWPATAPAAT
jgi:hypothetical protein